MTKSPAIPFLDLLTPHAQLEPQLVDVFRTALKSAGFIGGPMVEGFEQDFATYCDTRHCVGVGSGTDALRFALMAAGVGRGDTVVTVPNTFIATAEAISQSGASPEFVDVDESTYTMSPQRLEEYLTAACFLENKSGNLLSRRTGRRIAAIVPVHLYGQMADMDPILALADRYNLAVIEDACQAHGAEYFSDASHSWRRAGSLGRAAAFSFYPGKNLGACGEAGAITTNDSTIAEKARMLRDHGQVKKYCHDIEGYNGRLDAIQAGILSVKLRSLPAWNRQRRIKAQRYNELFQSRQAAVTVPCEHARSRAVYHLYVIRVENRDELQSHLTRQGIATQIHYPTPLHLQRVYQGLGYKSCDFPVAERAAREILSLPLYPHLGLRQQKLVVEAVADFLAAADTLAAERSCVTAV